MSILKGALVAPFLFIQLGFAQTKAPVNTATPAAKAQPATTVAAKPAVVTYPFDVRPLTKVDAAALARGAKVYKANCVRCHNADPNVKGSIGPEQVDAPFEVFVSKIMTGKYPDPLPKGFVPKRKSRSMTPLKNMKTEIPYIYAWVQSVKKKKASKP